jgi:hypothetical protein
MMSDTYSYDPSSDTAVPGPQDDPTRGLPPWAMSTLAQQMYYEPQQGSWPDPNAVPKARRAPVPGDPDYQWAIGQWAAPFHGATQTAANLYLQNALPVGGRLGLGAQLAMDTDEAEAGKAKSLKAVLGDVLGLANPRLRARAEALQGSFPQYAESYPPVGPPELVSKLVDPKTGKFSAKPGPVVPYTTMEEALTKDAEPGFFLQKKLTPEAEAFAKARNTIQQDLDLHGYTPYFDPAKRFDVDPRHYGPFADTGTAAAPATAKTDAEWMAKYGTPEARAKLQEGYATGLTVPESDRWYHMGQLEKAYIDELGAEPGRAAFKREFGDMMAATTGGADPYNNYLMSQYANVMAKRGERLPERAYELPSPIGGRYASGNIAQAQKYIDEGMVGFDPAVNPKRYDFSSAFAGNPNAMTIDEQMYGALRPATTKESVGLPEWYGPATRVAREEAAKAGVDPRAFQDVAWAGLKKLKTGAAFDYEGPMINHLNRSIETTHRLTGMPRDEIVKRGVIRKEIPMYGLAGATTMGALARQDDYQ